MTMPKKLTIYSEGHGNDVKIMNEDGTILDGVRSAAVQLNAGEFNTVEIEVAATATSIKAHATGCSFTCPLCQEISDHVCEK